MATTQKVTKSKKSLKIDSDYQYEDEKEEEKKSEINLDETVDEDEDEDEIEDDICPFSDVQKKWLDAYLEKKVNELRPIRKRATKQDQEKLSEEEKQKLSRLKSQQYYNMSQKRVIDKVSNICKAILSNTSINKSYLTTFSSDNIEQLRQFVSKVKSNREYNDIFDLSFYIKKMEEKGLENKQNLKTVQLNAQLLGL